jgi:hypothetical protein
MIVGFAHRDTGHWLLRLSFTLLWILSDTVVEATKARPGKLQHHLLQTRLRWSDRYSLKGCNRNPEITGADSLLEGALDAYLPMPLSAIKIMCMWTILIVLQGPV